MGSTILIIIALVVGFTAGAMWKSTELDDALFEPKPEENLEDKLNAALEDEDYEEAARLRDKIKKTLNKQKI